MHGNRPVVLSVGGGNDVKRKTEIYDYSLPASQWEASMYQRVYV